MRIAFLFGLAAIVGCGGPPDQTRDLGDFMTHYKPYNMTTIASYNQVLLGGPNRDDVSLAQQEFVENVLDAEMVLSICTVRTT